LFAVIQINHPNHCVNFDFNQMIARVIKRDNGNGPKAKNMKYENVVINVYYAFPINYILHSLESYIINAFHTCTFYLSRVHIDFIYYISKR